MWGKQVIHKGWLLVLSGLWLSTSQAQPVQTPAAASDVVFVAEDIAPYHFSNEQARPDGALVMLASEVARQCRMQSRFELLPWSRGFMRSKEDADVVMVSLLRTPEREADFHWIGRVFKTEAYFVKLKARTDISVNSIEQARQYVAATIRGYGSEKWLRAHGFDEEQGNLAVSVNSRQLWGLLFWQRADLVLTNTLAMYSEVLADGYQPALLERVFEVTDMPTELYFATGLKTSTSKVERLAACLNKTKQDGTYHAILAQWQLRQGAVP